MVSKTKLQILPPSQEVTYDIVKGFKMSFGSYLHALIFIVKEIFSKS